MISMRRRSSVVRQDHFTEFHEAYERRFGSGKTLLLHMQIRLRSRYSKGRAEERRIAYRHRGRSSVGAACFPMIHRSSGVVAAGLSLLVLACTADRAPEQPAKWTLVEELRLDETATPSIQGSEVVGLAVSRTGNVFVLIAHFAGPPPGVEEETPSYTSTLVLFSPTGTMLRTIGRPGEVHDIASTPTGDIVAISDDAITMYTPSGERVRSGSPQDRIPTADGLSVVATDGTILVPFWRSHDIRTLEGVRDHRHFIQRTSLDGRTQDTIPNEPCGRMDVTTRTTFVFTDSSGSAVRFAIPYLGQPTSALSRDGTVWCTGGDRYHLVHRRIGASDTINVIERAITGPLLPDGIRSAVIAAELRRAAESVRHDLDTSLIPRNRPVIDRLFVDDSSRVWVRRAAANGTLTTFDVFDATGRAVATIETPLRPGGSMGLRPVVVGDMFYAVVEPVGNLVRARIHR
jgi:hypothetical protein